MVKIITFALLFPRSGNPGGQHLGFAAQQPCGKETGAEKIGIRIQSALGIEGVMYHVLPFRLTSVLLFILDNCGSSPKGRESVETMQHVQVGLAKWFEVEVQCKWNVSWRKGYLFRLTNEIAKIRSCWWWLNRSIWTITIYSSNLAFKFPADLFNGSNPDFCLRQKIWWE